MPEHCRALLHSSRYLAFRLQSFRCRSRQSKVLGSVVRWFVCRGKILGRLERLLHFSVARRSYSSSLPRCSFEYGTFPDRQAQGVRCAVSESLVEAECEIVVLRRNQLAQL